MFGFIGEGVEEECFVDAEVRDSWFLQFLAKHRKEIYLLQ